MNWLNPRIVHRAVRVAVFATIAFHSPRPLLAQSASDSESLNSPGGFVEKSNSTSVRPLMTSTQIQSLLPVRGAFVFPPPYNTQSVRITNGTDCGGSDCVDSVGYSYWNNLNNSAGSNTMLIFLSLNRARGGGGPTLFSYNKLTEEVRNEGPLFDAANALSWSAGEGWYFSSTLPTALYLNSGASLLRYDVLSRQMQTVFDAAPRYGSDKYIWQVHSSADDRVHSATLRSSATYEMLGCLAYREDTRQFSYFPKTGDLDECQIDKSGRWLVIKENVDGLYGEDNRIIDLQTGTETVLLDQNGAGGHSDNGNGNMVFSDNWHSLPGAIRVFEFGTDPFRSPLVYHSMDWAAAAPGHVSYSNAKPGTPLGQQYACGTGANRINSNRANEIICFRLDTSLDVLVVAPVMTNLDASGGGDVYAKLPKGNLDPTGQYLIWTSNMGGSRQDAFVVKVPSQLLVSPTPSGDTTPPVLSAVSVSQVTSGGASLSWTSNEPSTSQVEYGPTTAYGSVTSLDPALVISHTHAAGGLAAGTLYHVRARSRDAAGNLAVSGDFTFTTAVLTAPGSGPVGHWRLDESSGSLAADSSGNGGTGTLLNGPLHVPGRLGAALSFDGVDESVSVPHAAVLDAYPITVSLWVSTAAGTLTSLVNKYLPSSMSGYQVFTSGGNLCAWYFRDASNYVWDGSGCTLATPGFNDGQWHHVAFVVDASGGRLFVDGMLRASRSWTGTPGPTSTTQGLSLARYPGTALPCLPGRLDDVRIYNRALGASEVSSLFNVAPSPDTTPPVISWVFSMKNLAGVGQLVKWTTDEPSDSQVEYGTTTAYGSSTAPNPSLVVTHSQTISGLAPLTYYHYRVRSRDAAGNLTISPDRIFKTQ